jgi:hypothetical protein
MQPGKLHGVRTQTKEDLCQYFVRGGTEKSNGAQKLPQGHSQPSVHWVPGLLAGGKATGSDVNYPTHLASSLKKE